jgi:hypothetical protein
MAYKNDKERSLWQQQRSEPMQSEANRQAGCGNVVTFPKPYSRLAALNVAAYSRLAALNAHHAEAA